MIKINKQQILNWDFRSSSASSESSCSEGVQLQMNFQCQIVFPPTLKLKEKIKKGLSEPIAAE